MDNLRSKLYHRRTRTEGRRSTVWLSCIGLKANENASYTNTILVRALVYSSASSNYKERAFELELREVNGPGWRLIPFLRIRTKRNLRPIIFNSLQSTQSQQRERWVPALHLFSIVFLVLLLRTVLLEIRCEQSVERALLTSSDYIIWFWEKKVIEKALNEIEIENCKLENRLSGFDLAKKAA